MSDKIEATSNMPLSTLVLSLEVYTDDVAIESVVERITASVSRSLHNVTGSISKLVDNTSNLFTIRSDKDKLNHAIKTLVYDKFKNNRMVVPEGFSGNLTSYIEQVQYISNSYFKLIESAIDSFTDTVGTVITAEDFSEVDLYTTKLDKAYSYRESSIKDLNRYFGENDRAVVPVRLAFKGVEDIRIAFDILEDTTMLNRNSNVKRLLKKVDVLAGYINTLSKNMAKYETDHHVSQVKRLGTDAYKIGELVEYVSVLIYDHQVIVGTMDKLKRQILPD